MKKFRRLLINFIRINVDNILIIDRFKILLKIVLNSRRDRIYDNNEGCAIKFKYLQLELLIWMAEFLDEAQKKTIIPNLY